MQITDATKLKLAAIAKLLAEGFTGRIELECRDGGIGEWREIRVHRSKRD